MITEVSFITTVRNAEVFIEETLKSVLNQSISNWEFIIIDDGSIDGTLEKIRDLSCKDSRIKVIETGGIGRGKALNLAIENTKGRYIANIDADDPCHPQRAEIQKKMLDENEQFSLVASNSQYIDEDKSINWEIYNLSSIKIGVKDITITRDKPFRSEPINHSSVMFRKSDLIQIGKYDETRKMQFDAELWNRFAFKGYKIGLIPIMLSSKRIHSNQSFEIGNRKKYLMSALEINKSKIKELKLPPVYYIYVYLKFLYGFLPKSIRKIIKTM